MQDRQTDTPSVEMKEKGGEVREGGSRTGVLFSLVVWLEEAIGGEQPPCPGVWRRFYLLVDDSAA